MNIPEINEHICLFDKWGKSLRSCHRNPRTAIPKEKESKATTDYLGFPLLYPLDNTHNTFASLNPQKTQSPTPHTHTNVQKMYILLQIPPVCQRPKLIVQTLSVFLLK